MNQRLQILELPERSQRQILAATYGKKGLAVMHGERRIGWVVGEDDIRRLRDRLERRLKKQIELRLSDELNQLGRRKGIGWGKISLVQSAVENMLKDI